MNVIEPLGLLPGQPGHLHAAYPEPGFFDHAQYPAGMAAGHGVRLYDCKRLFN
jgi:hypothetical protein